MNGTEIKQTFLILTTGAPKAKIILDVPDSTVADCKVCFNVLANLGDADPLKDDKTSFLYKFSELTTSAILTLQKKEDGIFVDKQVLNDNSLGEFFPLGFIVDSKNRNYAGYLIYWQQVIFAYDFGMYRVKSEDTNIFGVYEDFSDEYCLLEYTPARANGTVKIETTTSKLRGDINDVTDTLDFGSGWYQSTRLCGIFGFDESDYTEERKEYRNGQQKWVKDEQLLKYILKLLPISAKMHNFVKTDILQADEILITDYNKNNPNTHVQVNVNRNGNYAPKWQPKTKVAMVDIQFKSAFNNLRKRQC